MPPRGGKVVSGIAEGTLSYSGLRQRQPTALCIADYDLRWRNDAWCWCFFSALISNSEP
jgi:hypothetical protein